MRPTGTARRQPSQRHMRWAAVVLMLLAFLTGISAHTAAINTGIQPWGFREILIGTVSDSICGGTHIVNGHGDAECTRLCVKMGAKYALVADRGVLTLNGHQAELNEFAGEVVMVTGIVTRNAMAVESVAPVYTSDGPIYAKDQPD